MKYLYAFLLFWGSFAEVLAQSYPRPQIDVKKFIDDFFPIPDPDQPLAYEDLYEVFYQLYLDPLDLNQAELEDLQKLFILSPLQINSFFEYRSYQGPLLSIYELQAIDNFDLATIYKLLPFVVVKDKGLYSDQRSLLQRIAQSEKTLLIRYSQDLEPSQGYQRTDKDTNAQGEPLSRYLGSPQRLYSRFRIRRTQDFSLGFTLEKDEGELLQWQPGRQQYGMDFISYHFYLENKGRFKSIALGDYQLQIGQGLLLSAGYNVGKGGETVQTIQRPSLGVRPFTSLFETGFLRGGAATYELLQKNGKSLEITGFYSFTKRDASLGQLGDSVEREVFISSIQNSGLHRTRSELAARKSIEEQTWGAHLAFKHHGLHLGVTFLETTFNLPLQRTARVYNQFEFSGKRNYNLGANYSYLYENLHFFGEIGRSSSGGMGLVQGLLASLTPTISVAVLYRNYQRNFHSFLGSAFGEATRNINEQGMYWGIKIQPNRTFSWSAYYDKFRFPWLKFSVDAPSEGYEYLTKFIWQPSKKITAFAQFRQEVKQENQPNNSTPMDFVVDRRRRNYTLNLDYLTGKFIALKSRVQWSDVKRPQENITRGFAIIQDLDFKWKKWELKTRWALFDTDNFDNAQYVYEDDVLYSFSFPAYSGRGIRNYFLLKYRISNYLTAWIKYARTDLVNSTTIGSGLDEITGNTRSEVRLQLKIEF